MPVWAYIYLTVIFFSGVYGGVKRWDKSRHYLFLEMLCVCFIIMLFALAYQLMILRNSIKLSIWMVLFIIYWEFWGNRYQYCLSEIDNKKTAFPYNIYLEYVDEKKERMKENIYTLTMYIIAMVSLAPVLYIFYKIVAL